MKRLLSAFLITLSITAQAGLPPLPSQNGNSGKYLSTNGIKPLWATISSPTSIEVFNTTLVTSSVTTGAAYFKAPQALTVSKVVFQIFTKGGVTSGSLTMDLKKNTTSDSVGMTSIFSTQPTINYATAVDYQSSSGTLNAGATMADGEYLRLDITAIPAGVTKVVVQVFATPFSGTAGIEIANAVVFASQITTGVMYFKAPYAITINKVRLQAFTKDGVVAGNLIIDLKKNTTPDSVGMTSIFSTPPTLDFSTISDYDFSTGTLNAGATMADGEYLRLDITSIPTGVTKMYIQVYAL